MGAGNFRWEDRRKLLAEDAEGASRVGANVCAGEAHWQLGRTEAHGRILKGMLSRTDHEKPILNDDDFRWCLKAAIARQGSRACKQRFVQSGKRVAYAIKSKMKRIGHLGPAEVSM